MQGNTHISKLVLFLCVFFCIPLFASAEESIETYLVDIKIYDDSSIWVQEMIRYDFGENDRRGIFREIPVSYETPYGNRGVDLEIISVTRDGFKEQYKESRDGRNKVIRIGNPDVYITGLHTYRITYKVHGAFNSFAEFDELYWNAIGTDWNVPIQEGIVRITAPEDILQFSCYQGFFGGNVDCDIGKIEGNVFNGYGAELESGSGITVAVALPKGAVTLPTIYDKIWRIIKNNLIILLPLIAFILMYRRWLAFGKDAKGRGTIVPEYEPPQNLTPLFLGAIVDGYLNDNDITAGILYLAEQGYLDIHREEKKRFLGKNIEYRLVWKGNYDELNHKEQLVAEMLFGINVHTGQEITLSELQKDTSLSTRRSRLSKHINDELKDQGYYANHPVNSMIGWIVLGILVGSGAFVFGSFGGAITIASIIVTSVVIIVFGMLMPKLSHKGALAREHILGFKKFLSVTEKDRLAFHNAPERTTSSFMVFLPFAVALGVEKKWADQFKDLEMQNPSWYHGGSYGNFSAVAFTKDMSSFSSSMSAGVTAASGGSGSSGGGFSGGGGGGGGGGSW